MCVFVPFFAGLAYNFFCVGAIIICICMGGWCLLYECIYIYIFFACLGFVVEG